MITRLITYAAVASLLILTGCSKQESVSNGDDIDSTMVPDSEMYGATIDLSDKGIVNTSISFDHYVRYESIDSGMAYVVNIQGYDSVGMPSGMLQGDSAVVREESGLMDVYGSVVLVSKNGYRLQTEYLRWDSHDDKITTDEFVRITRGVEWATGYGFRSDQEISRFKILRDARGTLFGAELDQP